MWYESLWIKTLLGIILGWIFSISALMNLGFIMASHRQIFLLIMVFGGIAAWGTIVTWFYCSHSLKKPALTCIVGIAISIPLNIVIY